MEISRTDLELDQDDPASLLGNGASALVYRGTFRLQLNVIIVKIRSNTF